ncbi:MAG: nucleotidyltransferase domain-containing protein [Nanoarchaeota archaeon]|nr:nucleotidyltransferase domain-containing protein [Nanoarchaeota archaeon]
MSTMLKTGQSKILKLFYEDKKSSFHLREISRKTKLYPNSITRFLNQLEKEGILTSQKDGNLKKYKIKKSEKLSNIFVSFDIERLSKLPLARRRAINYFLDKLQEKPIIALLFGSTAKETFRKDSDIDLFLIVNKKIDVDTSKDYVDAQLGIKVNCFQITYEDFKKEIKLKEDKVIQSALNTGYPIFNQMLFYEVYLNGD